MKKSNENFIEIIIKGALQEILTNIEDSFIAASKTYDAIIKCCIDKGKSEVLLSEVTKYLPYAMQGDYLHRDLIKLENKMALITTVQAVESNDLVIHVRGMDFDKYEFVRKPHSALAK